ncbi:hypothetical protein DAPPUDRAFT_330367 [Daphnia pulex]|uniref:Uncharacterized protein n=1 Tax=Daphnia pulex TaxID=6669 RepID=E9HJD3_DAPPU|nr:hypothetical protein DAPPUDRAFT_330367 [Daphnia pulex]|eukprot:EFX68164.1 hypothetical protein DAPPUDRAFT_330367 [Daphnia pulex]
MCFTKKRFHDGDFRIKCNKKDYIADWDYWQPDFRSFGKYFLDNFGSLDNTSHEILSSTHYLNESCSTEKAIGLKENIPVRVKRNPEQKIPYMAALVDGRKVREVVLDINGHDPSLIGIHRDMKKLYSFVNATSVHQFQESDILAANKVVIGHFGKAE